MSHYIFRVPEPGHQGTLSAPMAGRRSWEGPGMSWAGPGRLLECTNLPRRLSGTLLELWVLIWEPF